MVDVPSAQERVTANATPAEAMAWTNADSRVAGRQMETERGVKHGDFCNNVDPCRLEPFNPAFCPRDGTFMSPEFASRSPEKKLSHYNM